MAKAATYEDVPFSFRTMNEVFKDLRGFISSIHKPKFADAAWAEAKTKVCQELAAKMAEMHDYVTDKKKSFSESFTASLARMQQSLQQYSAELKAKPNSARLQALYAELADDYEELVANIRTQKITQIKAIHLKPVNYARNIFHVLNGITCVLLYQFVLSKGLALWLMGSVLSVFLFLEVIRRSRPRLNDFLVDKVFGTISRPHEKHKVNGSTNYLIAMILLVIFFPKPIVLMSVLVLGFADPAASVVGKLWGRRKLFREKSFLGTGTFLATSMAVCLTFMALAAPEFSFAYALLAAAVVSVVATATELFSTRIDDNLSIPLMAAVAAVFFF
jgi:dolichol kinase